jgi:transposase
VLRELVGIHVANPYTSQVCDECLAKHGVAKRTRDPSTPYHVFKCTECGHEGDRDQVASRSSALMLKQKIEEGESMDA